MKEKYIAFACIMFGWGVLGWFWNAVCRISFTIPIQEAMHLSDINRNPWTPTGFLTIMTMTGFASMVVLFKHWIKKQKDFLTAQHEKVSAELQLLKAQIHPHFLFNTLNNIYSFSLENSPKTPQLLLKLSSLLSYMLYDCKSNEVMLAKELDVMKDYIDLEKERYGNKLEVSLNMEGDIKDNFIAPLLLLPFLENAFKHGTSEQLEKPWLSMDVAVKNNMLRCKIVNSKNEPESFTDAISNTNGIGIQNVKKRLAYLYPGRHELKIIDEGNFFVVSLLLDLKPSSTTSHLSANQRIQPAEKISV
ncbi:MAG TPA: histidine kinase [Phnomibacter sp.]|nr:histidine kinase [Phnomibacter sp.]